MSCLFFKILPIISVARIKGLRTLTWARDEMYGCFYISQTLPNTNSLQDGGRIIERLEHCFHSSILPHFTGKQGITYNQNVQAEQLFLNSSSFYSATILRPGHVRGVVAHFSNFPWIGGTLVPGPGALSRLLPYHHRDDNTPGVPGIRDGASGIPPKVINFKIL